MYKILMSEGEHAFTGVATSPRHYKRGMACVKNRDMMWATLYNACCFYHTSTGLVHDATTVLPVIIIIIICSACNTAGPKRTAPGYLYLH
jgi:hypothetical protein